jgi:hypothetical protein
MVNHTRGDAAGWECEQRDKQVETLSERQGGSPAQQVIRPLEAANMNTIALVVLGVSMPLGCGIRELGAILRQRTALRTLERLAERSPDGASFLPAIVEAAGPGRSGIPGYRGIGARLREHA